MTTRAARALPFAVAVVLALAVRCQEAVAAPAWRMYASPAEAGFDSERVAGLRERAEAAGSAALMAVFRGHVLVALGDIERRFECHSVRKSLVSALVGIHAGRDIDLDRTLEQLGIDDVPPLSEAERQATLRQLLAARSGVYHAAAKEPPDMKRERPERGSHAPGTQFCYNNWDFNTVGIAFAKATGKDLFAQFEAEIARPLGMQDFRAEDAVWQLEPSSSIHPAYAFRLSARDLARFGWMFACGGEWRGKQVVPRAWVAESTSLHSKLQDGRGYGFMWWVYPAGYLGTERYPALDPHDKFAAVGTGGQFVLVVPGVELVLVHRGDTDNGRDVRGREVWAIAEHLLAARTGTPAAEPRLVPLAATPLAGAMPPPRERRAVELPQSAIDAVLGEYGNEQGMRVTLHRFEGRLFALAHGLAEIELRAESENVFFAPFANVLVELARDAAGRVTGAKVAAEGRTIEVARR